MLRLTLVILAICSFLLSGCGTFSDAMCGPIDDHVFYRGVRLDVAAVKEGGSMTLMAADIPFSAVTDTFLVPYLGYEMLTNPPGKPVESASQERAKSDNCKADSLSQQCPKE